MSKKGQPHLASKEPRRKKANVDASDNKSEEAQSSDNDSKSASYEDSDERNDEKNMSGDSGSEASDTSSVSASEAIEKTTFLLPHSMECKFVSLEAVIVQ